MRQFRTLPSTITIYPEKVTRLSQQRAELEKALMAAEEERPEHSLEYETTLTDG